MAKNFKKQIAERNKQGIQQPVVPGVQENLIQREAPTIPVVGESGHGLLSEIARPELTAAGQIVRVRLSEVYATEQVRPDEDFEEPIIQGLTDTYSVVGVLAPPRAFPRDKKGYRIWLGETRVRAARLRGDEFIDLYIGEAPADEKKRILGQLIENLHQSGLKPLATANNLLSLKRDWGMTGEEIAKSLGKPTAFVSKHMRLCDAPEVITSLLKDKVTADVDLVYTLCQIHDAAPEEAARLATVARNEKLTRSQAKSVLDGIKGRKPKQTLKTKEKPQLIDDLKQDGEQREPDNETLTGNAQTSADQHQADVVVPSSYVREGVPKVMVTLGQEHGHIILKVPAESGMIWVEFPSGERCVEAISLIVQGVKEA
ncbi:ParB/RepB/Spo0J family partition protein [Rahnella sp. BCC 1045]|uniref:ParB/RepB/Spo0J family partition protein n=1 Tax=Rahnella sp. BCC 1045 TaxID=2816251 RepID=UPI001C2686E2|nr:ParB/RepB/Spo0J family partition protein [Rahnella sp. BCC 1045]